MIAPSRATIAAIALALAAILAGCGEFKPLRLEWPGSSSASRPDPAAKPPADAGGTSVKSPSDTPPEVQAGQDDLAARVKAYADSVSKQMDRQDTRPPGAEPDRHGPVDPTRFAAGALPAPRGSGGQGGAVQASETASPAEPAQATDAASGGTRTNGQVAPPPEAIGDTAAPMVRVVSGDPAGMPAPPPTTNQVMTTAERPIVASAGPRDDDGDALADAIAAAEAEAQRFPADFRRQLRLRMLYLAAGRSDEASAPWAGGASGEQKLLAQWIAAAGVLQSARHQSDGTASAEALAAIDRLREQLAAQAALQIRTVQLVQRVDGFGVVTPFDADAHRPGQWVIVYSELDHFTSSHEKDGRWRTELALRIEVLTADGRTVQLQEDARVVDYSVNHRRDFFLARRLRLSRELTPGQYVMKVAVEDLIGGKVAETIHKFKVN